MDAGYVVPLPSGACIVVHPPEWKPLSPRLLGNEVLYYVEFRSASGTSYVFSRDRDERPPEDGFLDCSALCEDLVREGYVSREDLPAIQAFLELDPEQVSLAVSVMLS